MGQNISTRPWLLKLWIALSTRLITIQWISIRENNPWSLYFLSNAPLFHPEKSSNKKQEQA